MKTSRGFVCILVTVLIAEASCFGQNIVTPKQGIPIPQELRQQWEHRIKSLEELSDEIRRKYQRDDSQDLLRFLPDAEVFHVCVAKTLEDEIFFKKNEFESATAQLDQGEQRLRHLLDGKTPWNDQRKLVIRGYRSQIDGSLQPYALWVPPGFQRDKTSRRLDIWYHGRSNTLSEVAFIGKGEKNVGVFSPSNTFILAPYGRFCNAMKFAGEVDTWEALEHARQFYKIDDDRISVRGFSMGGAATWHMGTHHASRWAAVNPGAGFVETKIYQKLIPELDEIPSYEQKLWHLYDSLDYALNLENTTLVAYSGELDRQKAAADLMEAALAQEDIKMTHIIGPNTGHKYEPQAASKVAALVTAAASQGRTRTPKKIRFVTYTLKYNQMHWVTVDGLKQHWNQARVEAEFKNSNIHASTKNVSGITFSLSRFESSPKAFILDNQRLEVPADLASNDNKANFIQVDGKWQIGERKAFRKKHDLQGPIDDAFMDSFLFVAPDVDGWYKSTDEWVKREFHDAAFQWRRQMRGIPRIKSPNQVTKEDFAKHNMVLWGDPQSNSLIAKMLPFLPLEWTQTQISIGNVGHNAKDSVPALIYPSPMNPKRYIVINSGQTFMQYGAQSNSMQTPKLPDFAILDTSVSVRKRMRGNGVRDAGFFDEFWKAPTAAK